MVEVVEKAGASASSVAGEGALNGRIHALQVPNVNGSKVKMVVSIPTLYRFTAKYTEQLRLVERTKLVLIAKQITYTNTSSHGYHR